jgi:hypothetical protein
VSDGSYVTDGDVALCTTAALAALALASLSSKPALGDEEEEEEGAGGGGGGGGGASGDAPGSAGGLLGGAVQVECSSPWPMAWKHSRGFNPWAFFKVFFLVSSLCFQMQLVPLHLGELNRRLDAVEPLEVRLDVTTLWCYALGRELFYVPPGKGLSLFFLLTFPNKLSIKRWYE